MEKQKKQIFLSQPAEQLAIKDTLRSLRVLIPIVAALQVLLIATWYYDVTGDRYVRGSMIYLGGYIFMFFASISVGLILKNYSRDTQKYSRQIFHTQMTYAWMLPCWAAVLTVQDAWNASPTFTTLIFVMANVLTMGICFMPPKKWTLIQCVTGLAVFIAVVMMPLETRFVHITELAVYLVISVIAGRFVFWMKMNNYNRQAELEEHVRMVEYDSLTDAYTREAFYRRVEELLRENPNTAYTLIASDIDNFKHVNSIFGNGKGDEVLCYLAREYRKHGLVTARYGADQFLSLLPASEKLPTQELYDA